MKKVYYHCCGALSDQSRTKFDLSAKFCPVDFSPNVIIQQIIEEIYLKFNVGIDCIDALNFYLCDSDGDPVTDVPF